MRGTWIVAGVLSVGTGLVLTLQPVQGRSSQVAMITGIYGSVTVQHGSAGSPQPATVHGLVRPGDIIATDDTGRAALLLADGSIVKLQIDTRVQFPASGQGLNVLDGEVYAHMQKQHHGPFQFGVPHGHAAVLGTDLDVKVAKGTREVDTTSTLTVVNGKVALGGTAADGTAHASRVVEVPAGQQSVLAVKLPEQTFHSALLIAQASDPVEVDVDPIVAWNKEVQAYSDVISHLHDQIQMIAGDAKAHNGLLSPELMEQLNDSEALIQSLVPDDDFRRGHQDLLLAFQNYKVALSMTANPALQAQAQQRADGAYQAADLAFRAYMEKNRSRVSQFLGR